MIPLLVGSAHAHVPHDAIVAVAPPADLTTPEGWYMTMSPHGTPLFYTSDTGGLSWDLLGGEHTGTELVGLARTAERVVALAGPVLWASTDGRAWTRVELPEEVVALESLGDTLALAGTTCLWTGPALGPFDCAVEGAVGALGPDAAVVDDTLWIHEGTSWVAAGSPGEVTAALAVDGVAYAGTVTGEVFRYDGAWTACGALPPSKGSYSDVVRLAWTGDALLVATAMVSPYVSTDGCATFEDRGTGEPVLYGQEGGPSAPPEATVFLAGQGDRWVTAGWAGLYLSDDAGASWTPAATFTADYVRGLAFSPDFPGDPYLYVGGYAAAIERTADGGASWDAPAHGLEWANAQVVEVSPVDTERVYAVLGHAYSVSADQGSTWAPFAGDMTFAGGIVPFPDPGRVWVWGGGVVEETTDNGATWNELTALERTMGPGLVQATWFADETTKLGRVCASATEPMGMGCGALGDREWRLWFAGDGSAITAPVVWPGPAAPERILVAAEGSVVTFDTDADALATVELDPDDLPHRLVGTSTGAVFLATRAGAIWRSLDGGETFTILDMRLPGAPSGVAARPDFAVHPEVLFGTHDGLWLLADAAGETPTLTRFQGHQRIDDASDFFVCTGCPDATHDEGASLDTLQDLPTGAVAEVWVRGVRVRVEGTGGDAGGTVRIDGYTYTVASGEARGTVLDVEGLDDTWHLVELVGAGEQGWRVDSVEAWRNAAALDLWAPEETGDTGETGETRKDSADTGTPAREPPPSPEYRCACGGPGSSSVWLAAPGLLLALRRRRHHGNSGRPGSNRSSAVNRR